MSFENRLNDLLKIKSETLIAKPKKPAKEKEAKPNSEFETRAWSALLHIFDEAIRIYLNEDPIQADFRTELIGEPNSDEAIFILSVSYDHKPGAGPEDASCKKISIYVTAKNKSYDDKISLDDPNFEQKVEDEIIRQFEQGIKDTLENWKHNKTNGWS